MIAPPFASLDLETTGTDPEKDRIVEIALLHVDMDGNVTRFVERVNPGVPIPAECTKVHGISDADVIILTFDFGQHGEIGYVSNGVRADVVKTLEEFLGNVKRDGGGQ